MPPTVSVESFEGPPLSVYVGALELSKPIGCREKAESVTPKSRARYTTLRMRVSSGVYGCATSTSTIRSLDASPAAYPGAGEPADPVWGDCRKVLPYGSWPATVLSACRWIEMSCNTAGSVKANLRDQDH